MISKAFLHGGHDLEVLKGVFVRHPVVGDVLQINHGLLCEDYYWAYVSLLLSDPYDHMVFLDDNGIDYETVSPFDVFVLRWTVAQQEYYKDQRSYDAAGVTPLTIFHDALAFFFGDGRRYDLIKVQDQFLIIDLEHPDWVLNKDAFLLAAEFIKLMNCVTDGDRIKPATPFAKQVLIEDARTELKKRMRKSQEEDRPEQIGDAMSAVFACGAGAITPTNHSQTHIYTLLSAANAIRKQMVVQALLNGIHVGMVKTDKITDKDLRWT